MEKYSGLAVQHNILGDTLPKMEGWNFWLLYHDATLHSPSAEDIVMLFFSFYFFFFFCLCIVSYLGYVQFNIK